MRWLGWLLAFLTVVLLLGGCVNIDPSPLEMAELEPITAAEVLETEEATATAPPTETPRPVRPTRVPATATPSATATATTPATATATPPAPASASPTPAPTVVRVVAPTQLAQQWLAVTPVVSQLGAGPVVTEETPTPVAEEAAEETATPAASPTAAPACAGDEAMTFDPPSPLVGMPVTITVSSTVGLTGVRLTGQPTPQFMGPIRVDNRFLFRWQVTPPGPGRFDFNFFIVDSLLCSSNGFTALEPTPTPTPTPIPTPTAVPAPHIERMLPSHGPFGTPVAVTIHGRGFGASRGSSVLLFNRAVAPADIFVQWGDYFIVLNSFPSLARGRYEVQVIVNGMRSNVVYWTVD